MLLPTMTPLGDVDEDELAFTELGPDLDIPPAISGTRRQMLLTRLVLALKSGDTTPDHNGEPELRGHSSGNVQSAFGWHHGIGAQSKAVRLDELHLA